MSMDFPQRNKMMTEPPSKKEFHFSGDGIWHNSAIIAETREEAEKLWHATKRLINPSAPIEEVDTAAVLEQSTPAPETAPEEDAVQ